MPRRIGLVTVVVSDYDEAISYYVGRLGFALVEDTQLVAASAGPSSRRPTAPGAVYCSPRAADEKQRQAIGAQTGGRVFLFLYTDDFARDYAAYRERGVVFSEPPRRESYGTVAVFTDLYGNRWDLIEPK